MSPAAGRLDGVSGQAAFRDRARAESFGAAAQAYDRFRPSYPESLVTDLARLAAAAGGRRALDVGCGTGLFARLLTARGLDVLGVDVDPDMAAVAREHGVQVEVAPFETWDDRGRRFELITCAQAWHWIDPALAAPKAAQLLRPGGTLAVFWNYGELEPDLQRLTERVYERVVPGWDGSIVVGHLKDGRRHVEELRDCGRFAVVGTFTYDWRQDYTPTEWVSMVQTHSNHLRLPPHTRAAVARELIAELTAEVGRHGRLSVAYGTYTVLARTPRETAATARL